MVTSHVLCEKHKNRCPCGSLVGQVPSSFITEVLQNMPWMCQNYKNGCHEIKMNPEDLECHQRGCIYRLVFCPAPSLDCQRNKILFKDVFEHYLVSHKVADGGPIDGEKPMNLLDFFQQQDMA